MVEFDVILGMDSFSPYHAILDCHAKKVTLAMPGLPRLEWRVTLNYVPSMVVSFLKAHRLFDKGCDAYLAFVRDVSVDTPKVESVLIVRDYPDIFSADLLCMPPDRDIDFGVQGLTVCTVCDASRVGLRSVLMQDGRVIANASRQLKVHEKNYNIHDLELAAIIHALFGGTICTVSLGYDITILYHLGKANVVADALSRKEESLDSLAYLPATERPLALDVQALANQFVRLNVLKHSRDLACMKYHVDPSHVLDFSSFQLDKDLSYIEEPVTILDMQVRKLTSKSIVLVKVQWRGQPIEEATWETEHVMRSHSPHIFVTSGMSLYSFEDERLF
ncbi:uncharacterized protein [Nicotiana tomentosiformis]|uniref:uncharacterized protein n=1 Tax=Nicotiana tomentosiformis TaxID=4098 RepID=UPI00388C78B6